MDKLLKFNNKLIKKGTNIIGKIPLVKIGNQIWMSENLAINDGGLGIYTRELHNVNGVDMGTQYYYTWDAAVRVASSIEGWHLPSNSDFETLFEYVGGISIAGKKLKSTSGWIGRNGTDDYGFTALPVGLCNGNDTFDDEGTNAYFWSTTLFVPYAYRLNLYGPNDQAILNYNAKGMGYSVRLIKDA